MADVADMWMYVQDIELGPVLPRADELFAERSGTTRAEALEQQPLGGAWVDAWLAALQEAIDAHRGTFYGPLTGVNLAAPSESSRRDNVSEDAWRQSWYAVDYFWRQVHDALDASRFVLASSIVGELWAAMGIHYQQSTDSDEFDITSNWTDLRPLMH